MYVHTRTSKRTCGSDVVQSSRVQYVVRCRDQSLNVDGTICSDNAEFNGEHFGDKIYFVVKHRFYNFFYSFVCFGVFQHELPLSMQPYESD